MAVHGLKNFWSKRADASFHLTIVACIAANGFAGPPLYVLPGQHVSRDMMDGCDITGGAVIVAPKGFMNASSFEEWLHHFHSTIPEATKRPLILVYDGYSSHFNKDIVTKAISFNIVFGFIASKRCNCWILPCSIKQLLYQIMIEKAILLISKRYAIEFSSIAWTDGIQEKKTILFLGLKPVEFGH